MAKAANQPLKITDLTFRDGHQSLFATRMRTEDIEAIAGITGGNIFHGELLVHQIFFLRPTPQWADFRTPLKGYYFGASGAHPGGGVMGAAGMLAAKEILKDRNF